MILRIVPGRLPRGRRPVLVERYRERYAADAVSRRGLLRHHVGVDEAREAMVAVTAWRSVEDARRVFGPELATSATLGGLADVLELGTAAHFDIEDTWIERRPDAPRILRLAVGRFTKPSADVEMQDLLAARMPSLPAELVTACAGRRIVGRTVEVIFFSTWLEEPAAFPLHQALWPDISLRYDEFSVATYEALPPVP